MPFYLLLLDKTKESEKDYHADSFVYFNYPKPYE
jgi:hypothetical protein